MAAGIPEVDSQKFQDVLNSGASLVVDFYADWCGPCRIIAPIIQELAKEYEGRVQFVKVNVDYNPGLAEKYGVMGIPTVVLFTQSREVKRLIGAAPKHRYAEEIVRVVNGSPN